MFVRGEGDDATPVLDATAKSVDDILGGARAPESTTNFGTADERFPEFLSLRKLFPKSQKVTGF